MCYKFSFIRYKSRINLLNNSFKLSYAYDCNALHVNSFIGSHWLLEIKILTKSQVSLKVESLDSGASLLQFESYIIISALGKLLNLCASVSSSIEWDDDTSTSVKGLV